MTLRTKLIEASAAHFRAHIEKHRLNVEVLLENPTAIHGHADIMDAIETELEEIANYEDKLDALKYF